ncbi:MAG TPA: hypothetical protein VJ044_09940, partial [Candidatus Hodarchaeales archaeon]|nr:hypothetical protein [Candidatus Hodarchaeales archaeon]
MTEPSPTKGLSSKKTKIFKARLSRTSLRRKSIRVTDQDIIWHTWFELIPNVFLGAVLGFVGSSSIWLGLAVTYPIFLEFPYTLLAFEIVGITALTLLAAFRNRLLKRIISHGFVFTFSLQRIIFWAYYGAILLALYPLLSLPNSALGYPPLLPNYSPAISIVLIGLFFFLIAPRFALSRFLWEVREARLSLLQFLAEWVTENPRYFWLRRGMQGVEQRLRNSGLSIGSGVVFHG